VTASTSPLAFRALVAGLSAGGGGIAGPTGIDGQDGEDGATGPRGQAGETGANGTNGTNGTNGSSGAAGQQGPPTWMFADDPEDPPSRPPGETRLDQLGHATPTIGGPDGVAQRLVTYQTRQPRYWLKNPASTSFTSVGMIAAPTVTSFAAGGTTGDTATRPYLTINTTTTIDQEASVVSTTAFLRRAFMPTLVVPIHAGDAASQSNIRRWIGFWSATLAAVSTPTTQHVAAFRYDTALDGTAFWRCVTCDGASNVTTTTTTIAADTTSAERIFRIEMNGSLGQISFYIDDVCVALHSTNLPGNTSAMIVGVSMTTLTAAARNMRVGSLTLIHT